MEKGRQTTGTRFSIDPAHTALDIYAKDFGGVAPEGHTITLDIWRDKYRWGEEEHPFDSMRRVIEGVYAKDPNKEAKRDALEAMQKTLWVPAGRIQAGAGTSNIVTLINCFVCRNIEDSMDGIMDAFKDTMLTLQQGGGDGMNFCVAPGTRILMHNGVWREVEEIQSGEKLVGFDEYATHHKFDTAIVESNESLMQPCYKVSTKEGDVVVSSNHMFLARRTGVYQGHRLYYNSWIKAKDLLPNDVITYTCAPWDVPKQEDLQDLAWFAGMLDGEGCWNENQGQSKKVGTLSIGQNPGPVLDRLYSILDRHEITYSVYTKKKCQIINITNRWAVLKLLAYTQPTRFYLRINELWIDRQIRGKTAGVISIEDVGEQLVYAIKTSTRTLITNGLASHNSTLRPALANLNRTGAIASGPLPFMDTWDAGCGTIMSAGSRRGAMMAVLDIEHPDVVDFIKAKQTKGRWTNFNVSVLITDAFLDAVKHNEDWFLGFNVPRKDGNHLFVTEKETEDGDIELWYAYSRWSARKLWDLIIRNTYEWSEPGIILIDRINRQNNLQYCEIITGTNPCGEQPLPPDGCCNLGAVNLARMVTDPFSQYAKFDYSLLEEIAALGTRYLDNVIDVTLYPLEGQAKEEYAKRRIGVGITGLANCLAQLGIRYGSKEAISVTEAIMKHLCNATYASSALLAAERTTFPLYDADQWGIHSPIVAKLDPEVKELIAEHGMRNGVLLTIAPTGTTSLYAGNISSGLEPVFRHKAQRNVRQADESYKPYTVYDYGYLLHKVVKGRFHDIEGGSVGYMVTHDELTVREHLLMQAACQRWIDASVSKTINCPPDITFDEFKHIYEMAHELGCKGCTTYRYSEVRGSILSPSGEAAEGADTDQEMSLVRPDVLSGQTYKLVWPNLEDSYYVTINNVGEAPFEMFIQSTSSKYADWATALSLMISAIMRKGGDIDFISRELMKVRSADDAGYVGGKFYGSLVALIGDTIGKHHSSGDIREVKKVQPHTIKDPQVSLGETCPACNQPAIFRIEGCDKCTNCTYSKC